MNIFEKYQNTGGLLTLLSESFLNQNPKISGEVLSRGVIDECGLADEEVFTRILCMERRQTDRSGDPFALVLVDLTRLLPNLSSRKFLTLCKSLRSETRDSDFDGWYSRHDTIGIIFAALREADRSAVEGALAQKIKGALSGVLPSSESEKVKFSFHFYPELFGSEDSANLKFDTKLHSGLDSSKRNLTLNGVLKKMVDIVGSLAALVLFSPLSFCSSRF